MIENTLLDVSVEVAQSTPTSTRGSVSAGESCQLIDALVQKAAADLPQGDTQRNTDTQETLRDSWETEPC